MLWAWPDGSGDRQCATCGHTEYKQLALDDGRSTRPPKDSPSFYDVVRARLELAGVA